MNRLEKRLEELRQKKETALILYITAGDPNLAETLKIMQALVANGTDCIELGVPFSDPIADGPIIQRAAARALKNSVTLDDILMLVNAFRETSEIPVVLMGYYNPIIRYGNARFADACSKNGVDGLIVADLPYEEGEEFEALCRKSGINLIYLLAPELGSSRTKNILQASSGFVYCVSHYGTTGTDEGPNEQLATIVHSLRSMTDLPIAVGFGVSSIQHARAAAAEADGVIIGSWLIKELEGAEDKVCHAGEFARKVKNAISRQG
jgi:tryptophan synthase alpha chain